MGRPRSLEKRRRSEGTKRRPNRRRRGALRCANLRGRDKASRPRTPSATPETPDVADARERKKRRQRAGRTTNGHKNLAKYRKTPEFRVAAERNERIFVKMAKMGKAAKSKSRRICPGPLAKREASRIMTAFLRLKKRRLHYNRNFLTGKSGARKFRRTFAAENETSREDLTAVCEK